MHKCQMEKIKKRDENIYKYFDSLLRCVGLNSDEYINSILNIDYKNISKNTHQTKYLTAKIKTMLKYNAKPGTRSIEHSNIKTNLNTFYHASFYHYVFNCIQMKKKVTISPEIIESYIDQVLNVNNDVIMNDEKVLLYDNIDTYIQDNDILRGIDEPYDSKKYVVVTKKTGTEKQWIELSKSINKYIYTKNQEICKISKLKKFIKNLKNEDELLVINSCVMNLYANDVIYYLTGSLVTNIHGLISDDTSINLNKIPVMMNRNFCKRRLYLNYWNVICSKVRNNDVVPMCNNIESKISPDKLTRNDKNIYKCIVMIYNVLHRYTGNITASNKITERLLAQELNKNKNKTMYNNDCYNFLIEMADLPKYDNDINKINETVDSDRNFWSNYIKNINGMNIEYLDFIGWRLGMQTQKNLFHVSICSNQRNLRNLFKVQVNNINVNKQENELTLIDMAINTLNPEIIHNIIVCTHDNKKDKTTYYISRLVYAMCRIIRHTISYIPIDVYKSIQDDDISTLSSISSQDSDDDDDSGHECDLRESCLICSKYSDNKHDKIRIFDSKIFRISFVTLLHILKCLIRKAIEYLKLKWKRILDDIVSSLTIKLQDAYDEYMEEGNDKLFKIINILNITHLPEDITLLTKTIVIVNWLKKTNKSDATCIINKVMAKHGMNIQNCEIYYVLPQIKIKLDGELCKKLNYMYRFGIAHSDAINETLICNNLNNKYLPSTKHIYAMILNVISANYSVFLEFDKKGRLWNEYIFNTFDLGIYTCFITKYSERSYAIEGRYVEHINDKTSLIKDTFLRLVYISDILKSRSSIVERNIVEKLVGSIIKCYGKVLETNMIGHERFNQIRSNAISYQSVNRFVN